MAAWLNIGVEWFADLTKPAFRAMSWLMGFPMQWVADFLAWTALVGCRGRGHGGGAGVHPDVGQL